MRVLHILLATVVLALTLAVAPLSSQTVDERLHGFDQWVESVMAEWKVPGLGVAIVEDGETVFAKGYGWRNVEQQLPRDPGHSLRHRFQHEVLHGHPPCHAGRRRRPSLGRADPHGATRVQSPRPGGDGRNDRGRPAEPSLGPSQARPVLAGDRQESHRVAGRTAPPGALRFLQEQVLVPEPDVPHRRRGR